MKIRFVFRFNAVVVALAFLTCGMTQSRAQEGAYTLDDQHTSIVFAVDHLGFSHCFGMFGKYSGKFTFDADSPTSSQFQFTIDAASLDTKSAKRDEHLRGPDFFNVNQFPEITFVSKGVEVEGDVLKIKGDMTLHGVTKEIVMPLTHLKSGTNRQQRQISGFLGHFTIKRSDFEMKTFLPNLGDEVKIWLSFEGIK